MHPNEILNILIVDDEEIVLKTLGDYLRQMGHNVAEAGDGLAGLRLIETDRFDLALIDVRMPKMDGITLLARAREIQPEMAIVIITGHGNMTTAVQALREGASDFLNKPVRLLELDAVLEKTRSLTSLRLEKNRLRNTIGSLQALDKKREGNWRLVGKSPAMEAIRRQIHQSIDSRCDTILITGETGAGKEVVARNIHFQSCAENVPFIAVSAPAMQDTLAESELFGHTKGAFTGADRDRQGYFELADGGTLFLDEVGDLSPAVQAKLLRVLETRSLRRVGGSTEIKVSVRVIAATNADLAALVEAGRFRTDLFYRLNVFAIHIPPLRERPDDILPMAERFLEAWTLARGGLVTGFTPGAQQALMEYAYPGNARELRNIVERAAILCGRGRIAAEQLNLAPPRKVIELPFEEPAVETSKNRIPDEKSLILNALSKMKWNRREAARQLGIPYSTLRYKINKYEIG